MARRLSFPKWDEFYQIYYFPYPFLPSGIFTELVNTRRVSLIEPEKLETSMDRAQAGICILNQSYSLLSSAMLNAFEGLYQIPKFKPACITLAFRHQTAQPAGLEDIGRRMIPNSVGVDRVRQHLTLGLDAVKTKLEIYAAKNLHLFSTGDEIDIIDY